MVKGQSIKYTRNAFYRDAPFLLTFVQVILEMVKLRKTLSVCVAIFVFALLTQYSIQQTEKTTEVRYVNTSDDISENTMELHVKNAIEPDVENTMEPDVENIEHNSKCGEKEERAFKSDIDLAKVEFERVETIFVILVFIMIVVLAKMSKSIGWCTQLSCLVDCIWLIHNIHT